MGEVISPCKTPRFISKVGELIFFPSVVGVVTYDVTAEYIQNSEYSPKHGPDLVRRPHVLQGAVYEFTNF